VAFPTAQAGGVATPTNQGFTQADLAAFRRLAEQLKQQETLHRSNPAKGLDSVDALEVLIGHAANVTQNNPKHFVELMSEVLMGKETNSRTPGTRQRVTPRIMFGDLGMHPIYQDRSEMQMYHFWAYVHYGYFYPKDIAKGINFEHEVLEPQIEPMYNVLKLIHSGRPLFDMLFNYINPSSTGSRQDYILSGVGYNLGQALAKGHITPRQLVKMIDRILRTDAYRPFPDEKIPKELKGH
jgi:hypothetical protein